jgi:signal transduction histidine kinase
VLANLRRIISDRHRVFVAVIFLTILTILIVETVTVGATRSQLIKRTDSSLRTQAETSKLAVDVLTPQALVGLSKLARVLEQDNAVTVIDRKGDAVYQVPVRLGHASARPVLPAYSVLRSRLERPFDARGTGGVKHFRVIAGNLPGGLIIVYATPLTAIDGTIADLTRNAMLIAGVAMVLLGLILWRVLATATRPIDSMIDVAARIGDGDFTARVEPALVHGDASRLGYALNQMVSRIERAFAETSASEATLRRFVADASHELRTPLTSIRGYAQLLRMGAAGDEAEVATSRIDSEATRMALLVDDLLLLARLDQGRPLEREPVDVASLVRELGADTCMLEPQRPLRVDTPDAPVIVLGDEGRLRQLVTNLLVNVRHHTPRSTPCSLLVHLDDSDVRIVVADEGPGMDRADAERAFDRFYRADSSRSRDSGGSGLGLAIVKAIVEAHGGGIEMTATSGLGTTVTVHLPRAGGVSRGARSREAPTVRL